MYPNPAGKEIFLKGQGLKGGYKIFDTKGQEQTVVVESFGQNLMRFDLQALMPGMYVLVTEDGKSLRFVRE
jgi:hypothetical protein